LAVESGTVIRWGVDLDRFHPRENGSTDWGPRLLFAGRVVQEKGFLTVVDAVDLLVHDHRLTSLKCTVAGPSHDTGYLEEVHQRIRRAQLESYFSFVGEVAVDNMPDLYRRHDVFLLPSLWEEPFSIGLLEAMATGLAVIATATGGTPEILQDGVNGLFFEAGSARDLASKIVALDCNEHLRRQLASSAHTTIEEGFSIERMVDQVENLLIDLSPRNASA
jgi:glycosyltransferase involved in cell wall biosynthesis